MGLQNDQKLDIYNYFIASFDILYPSGGTTSIPPTLIYKMSKIDDYDNNCFPLFNVQFHVNINDYYKILKEKTGVKFRIRMQKGKMDKYNTTSTNVIKQDVFNEVFSCYISDSTPFYDEKLYKAAKETRGAKDSTTPEDFGSTMNLYLFKEKDIEGTRKIVNKVLGGLTLTDMVFDLYSSCGLGQNLLMQKFENNRVYSEIVIPPLPMLGTLQYLQSNYHNFYNGSSIIFFDFVTKYILKKQVGCAVWKSQEFKQTVFMVREASSSQRQQVSCEKNNTEKKYYISVSPDMVSVDKTSITRDATDASKIMLVDSKTGQTQTVNMGLDTRGSGSTKVVYHDQQNTRLAKEVEADLKSAGMSVFITCNNIDVDALTPNKEFVLKFLDKQTTGDLSGTYRLSWVSYQFSSNGSSGFNMSATIKLTK